MTYDARIEIRMKKETKKKLVLVALKNNRKPSEMGRILLEEALDSKKKRS